MEKNNSETPKKQNIIQIDEVRLDEDALETLGQIQSHYGYFYRKTIRKVCDVLIEDAGYISLSKEENLKLLTSLVDLRKSLEVIENSGRLPLIEADPFDARLAEQEAADEFSDDDSGSDGSSGGAADEEESNTSNS